VSNTGFEIISAQDRVTAVGLRDTRTRQRARSIILSTYMRASRSAAEAPEAFDIALAEYRNLYPEVAESSARHEVAEILSHASDPHLVG
jgi:hypothetical protein